jgi:outer membrane lipoprotein-sorting protein
VANVGKYGKVQILKRISALIIITVIVFITGCAGLIRRQPLSLDDVSIAKIRFHIEQNNLKYHSMKAKADISVESPKMSFAASSQVFVKKPDSLLITVRAPFGIGFGSLFIDRNQFLVYNSFNNNVYTGDPNKLELTKFLPINLKLENIIQAFSGIQLLDALDRDSLTIDHNKYLIVGSSDNQIRKYWIDAKKLVVTDFQLLTEDNEPLIKVEYKQFEKKDHIYLPKYIQIYQPQQNARLTILYTKRDSNCKLSEKDFTIKIPEQAERIEL